MQETAIDRELALLLEKLLDGAPSRLAEACRYAVLSPGKRLRPRIALATAGLLGLPPRASLPAALALELFHAFTLVHDDLPCMDDDDERRGKPSTHKAFGEAMALLAGDALSLLAARAFLHTPSEIPRERVAAALARFLDLGGASGVIGGQALEFSDGTPDLAALRELHRKKTGALFEAAFLLPFDLAGLSSSGPEAAAIADLASAFGTAFQVRDDLEDAGKSEAHTILRFQDARSAWESAWAPMEAANARAALLFGARAEPLLALLRGALGARA